MKIRTVAFAVGITLLTSGCATLFGGGAKQQITINSNMPMKVSIGYVTDENKTLTGKQSFTTPSTITMLRESDDLLLTSDNDEFESIKIESKMNNWVWGDILATSLLSTTVDAVTGAMWEYDDNITIESK